MDLTPSTSQRLRRLYDRRLLRWTVTVLLIVACVWLVAWLLERSLQSSSKRRAIQSWLDNKLNADVSNIGDMVVRLNLVRRSRLDLREMEIEHSNPLFPGKFAVVHRAVAASPPWAVARIWPGKLYLRLVSPVITLEENEAGEWSSAGLLQPRSTAELPFPFPIPKISGCEAEIENAKLIVRRHGYEMKLDIDGELTGRAGSGQATLHANKNPFTFGAVGADRNLEGSVGPSIMRFSLGSEGLLIPQPVAGGIEVKVTGLPVSSLPFFVGGIPLDTVTGSFNGLVSYQEHAHANGAIFLDGQLTDASLTLFGLPRQAPVRVTWPIRPTGNESRAEVRMGPSGFGAFEISIPLDADGNPRLLSMRGDVAALDGIPALFTRHSRWPDWLSRTFPRIEWRAGTWLGFGWTGSNMQLRLYRSTIGLNLSGEGEMMGGRVRLAMIPDQPETPITIAAEKLDAQLLTVKISQMLPEPFQTHLTGSHVNLTWRGFQSTAGEIDEWATGLVFAKPVIDVAASGKWWRSLSEIARAIAAALPEWGGGDAAELLEIAKLTVIRFDQLSLVSERESDGDVAVEFRAYGEAVGQATGMLEKRANGLVEGEFLLAGPSVLLDAAEKANPDLGNALRLLANDSMGLRVVFKIEPGGQPEFVFPFLDDAKRIHEDLLKNGIRQ